MWRSLDDRSETLGERNSLGDNLKVSPVDLLWGVLSTSFLESRKGFLSIARLLSLKKKGRGQKGDFWEYGSRKRRRSYEPRKFGSPLKETTII
jgi:hypothetical protein